MLKKVTERVYYMDYENTQRPVIGLVIGNNSCLVIDGGSSKEHFNEFKRYVEKMDIPPLKYLALTHSHENHVAGAVSSGLINIVNGMTNEKLKNKSYVDNNIFISDIIYDEFLKIDLGGIVVELERIPSDHTRDCSIIYIPSEKIVFLGDALYSNKKHKNLCYTNELMIPLLKELQCYEASSYIPAHSMVFNYDEFLSYSNKMITIAKSTKDLVSFEEAEKKVKEKLNLEIDSYDKELILAFLAGNKN
ncbi:MBL fold metallo-hydrolase [uncultured Clostridium sp.]|uniref:MBL fold metallo-hydrolase n=1 Tax=uncultured Clostridium sp. TaxID=59620 RepID=UPI00262BF7B0|nr:MBL fold metallo-hydrolase [uncultured Clostridium sp.]